MKHQTSFVTLTFLAALLVPQAVQAQVFGSGPSDPELFRGVTNLPVDRPWIGDVASMSNNRQLNVSDGGTVGEGFVAQHGCEVNINGGSIGENFFAGFECEVNISGGSVGDNLDRV